ncbi:MobV family relaxase [Clostridium perfringens]|mgnify:CR=1 FL=1|uniref:MobV family relaxase n=4 Tax=Clostridium perfringens TaxID=1502 RepID=UPI0036532BC2|nr:plasmid recombination protein [Clostridium perfringens]EHR1332821.1 plasmid recombination protein [Clostridium perfringens]EHR1426371.1 plasmid recombination protein [Clostridium perfringens]EIF6166339.1 plasmid recombination protein [Clostridium perfringens]
MSYLVFHLSKYKSSNIVGLQRHNQRENKNYSNQDIDITMSNLNYDLVNYENISFTKKVKDIIDNKRTTKKAIRKDAVTYCECIISSDNEFFRKLDIKEQQRFFEVSLKFLENRIGKDNIISANVHLDETTPHMHLGFVPMNLDGSLSAKKMVNRNFLREIQENLPYTLQKNGFDIQRGEKDNNVKHLDQKIYKSNLNKEIKRLEALNLKLGEITLDKKESLLGGFKLTREEFENLKDLAKSFLLNKDKLLELENLEQDLKDQQKSLYIKHKNLERLENKTNNLYKKQLILNHDFEELAKENEILSYKARKADTLELENNSLKQEIILLNQKLKEKSKQLDSANSTIDSKDKYIDIVNSIFQSDNDLEEFFNREFDKRLEEIFRKEQEVEKTKSKIKGMSM